MLDTNAIENFISVAETEGPKLASALEANEAKIVEELNSVQGEPVDLNGYYFLDPKRATEIMRPSATLNETIAMVAAKRK